MTASRQQYIDKYVKYAMEQMWRYGIPASITLAQGLIESADGKSALARTANNHFGIKGSYNGNYVLANDDKPNEKFKKYDNVSQSYDDHSKVLMASRYQKYVRNLSPDDYKGWAEGIKLGHYATDSKYASTIVNIIEEYNLQKYDQMVMEQMRKEGRQSGIASHSLISSAQSPSTSVSSNLKQTSMNLPQDTCSMPVKRDEFLLVTSPYGFRQDPMDKSKTQAHHGIDIKTHEDAVLATENNGTVVAVDNRIHTSDGKMVTVEYPRADGSKIRTQYMHLSQIDVKEGDVVNAGQKLGVSGNTGTRTMGEHLHFGVISVSADSKQQWVNPAAYLAEINQKNNLQKQVLHNGKDLLIPYQTRENQIAMAPQQSSTPEDWMKKLWSSDDAALGLGMTREQEKGGGLLDSIMKMSMTLLLLAMQIENKSVESKMQAATDGVVNRKIDLSAFVPNLKSAEMTIKENGAVVLSTDDGEQQYTHELTHAEQARLSQILNSDSDNATKQWRIGAIVNSTVFTQQASQNYEQIASQKQLQEQTLQRK